MSWTITNICTELGHPVIAIAAIERWLQVNGNVHAWKLDGSVVVRNMFEWILADERLELEQVPLSIARRSIRYFHAPLSPKKDTGRLP